MVISTYLKQYFMRPNRQWKVGTRCTSD